MSAAADQTLRRSQQIPCPECGRDVNALPMPGRATVPGFLIGCHAPQPGARVASHDGAAFVVPLVCPGSQRVVGTFGKPRRVRCPSCRWTTQRSKRADDDAPFGWCSKCSGSAHHAMQFLPKRKPKAKPKPKKQRKGKGNGRAEGRSRRAACAEGKHAIVRVSEDGETNHNRRQPRKAGPVDKHDPAGGPDGNSKAADGELADA